MPLSQERGCRRGEKGAKNTRKKGGAGMEKGLRAIFF